MAMAMTMIFPTSETMTKTPPCGPYGMCESINRLLREPGTLSGPQLWQLPRPSPLVQLVLKPRCLAHVRRYKRSLKRLQRPALISNFTLKYKWAGQNFSFNIKFHIASGRVIIKAWIFNFTLTYKWAGHNFDVEYLTEPYNADVTVRRYKRSFKRLKRPAFILNFKLLVGGSKFWHWISHRAL